MVRKLTPEMTLDTLEDEVIFTAAAVEADEDAADLLPMTADMLPRIDAVRVSERGVRVAVATTDAVRIVCNERLDIATTGFADDLLADCDKDRKSSRWLGFYPEAPSRFVKMPLADHILIVEGWIASSVDPIFKEHEPELSRRAGDAKAALVNTSAVGPQRSALHQEREALVKWLTEARDSLRSALAARAQKLNLPRTWPDTFFRVEK